MKGTLSHNLARLLAGAGTLSLGSFSATAGLLVSNLGEPTRATTELSLDLWAAQSFVTDNTTYQLSSVEVLIGNREGSPSVVAELHAYGGATGIGTTLSTFTIAPVPAGDPAPVMLVPNTAVTLDPHTTYWVVLGVSGVDSFGWSYAKGNATTGPGSLGAFGYSIDAGLSWAPGTFDTPNPHQLRVGITVIPEPTTAVGLSGLVLLAGSLVQHRRRCR